MWGPEGLTRAVATNLAASLPARIAQLRTKYGVDANTLPDVATVYAVPRDFADVASFPCIMLAAQETAGQLDTRQTDATSEYDEYTFTYRVRAMIFAMGTSFDQTELLTQRIVLAVREAFVTNKIYGDPENGDGGLLDSRQIRESYAETTASSGGFLGGAWVEIGIRSTERQSSLVETAVVDAVTTAVVLLPASADLPG